MNEDIKNLYPRPDFRRDEFINLNGKWDFTFDDENVGEKNGFCYGFEKQYDIVVPFCYQSKKSGINDTSYHPYMWYKTEFTLTEEQLNKRVFINFGAVDFVAKVWLNGNFIGKNVGGHICFSLELTNYVKEKNLLIVKAEDLNEQTQPRGKQYWKEKLDRCWYTPTSGIWQTVYLTFCGDCCIEKVKLTPNIDDRTVIMDLFLDKFIENSTANIKISYNGNLIKYVDTNIDSKISHNVFYIKESDYIDEIHHWTPETPNLYDLEVTIKHSDLVFDKIYTYFGMRKISVNGDKILLNNRPYYQKLILDQGYWEDSLLTPPDDEAIISDINLTKEMGFNGARKHQKIEDPRYYYWADKLGLLVWGEMPSGYEFNDVEIDNITNEWKRFIDRDYNHPCIVCWVPLNESWGIRNIYTDKMQQSFASAMYYLTKALDSTRLISTNDGWEQVESDICAIHDYLPTGELFLERYQNKQDVVSHTTTNRILYSTAAKYNGQPILITEFGGFSMKNNNKENWGYGDDVNDTQEFLERLEGLINAVYTTQYINGFCYTQLTDVMQETNGLLTIKREPKIPIKSINRILKG